MKTMTKICMLLFHDFIHDPRVEKEAESLVNRGFDVVVIAVKDKRSSLLGVEERNGYTIKRVTISSGQGMGSRINATITKHLDYVKLAIREGADIYHANDVDTLFHGYIAARRNKAKLVYDSHELWFGIDLPYKKRILFNLIEMFVVKKTDVVLLTIEERAVEFIKRYKIPSQKVKVIHNYASKDNLNVDEIKMHYRDKYKLADSDLVFLYQGTLNMERGIGDLIRGLAKATQKKRIKFFIVGDDRGRSDLHELTKKLNLTENIIFTGRVSAHEVAQYECFADVAFLIHKNLCLNSYYASTNKLYTYLYHQCALILPNFPIYKRIGKVENVGIEVDPDSTEQIGKAIDRMVTNEKRMRKMQQCGRTLINSSFNWSLEEKLFLNIYLQLEKNEKLKLEEV